ncbi:MAG: class I SAM-dependent methyltransferase [Candidatus Hodarchaeota archaeon]
MTYNFYEKTEKNHLDNLDVDVKKIYEEHPINFKVNPKPNKTDFNKSIFNKIYRNQLIPLKIRKFLWYYFRKNSIDNIWLDEFNKYWTNILKGLSLPTIYDLFFIKNIYRLKFQYNLVPDTTDPYVHLEAWQRPEVIYQLLQMVCKSIFHNECQLLTLLKKNNKGFKSFLEFGCATAPITTTFFEFFGKPKNINIYISDIQTLAFHYASYRYRKCSNVIPKLLKPENDFMLETDEKFDAIFCMTVFEHLNKPLEIIKTFDKCLNDQGLLFFDYTITSGAGLDTLHGFRERNNVLDYIINNFKLIYGKISKEKDMSLTIVKKI